MFTSAGLIESLRQHRLLDGPQLDEANRLAATTTEPRQFANELSRRGWLTPFQVRMLAQGRGEDLVVGPYIVLEKLGEGGMGAVFKARNVRLSRVVAIKLLRKERGTSVEVVRRFRREVEVVSSLDHPNVVRAFDAVEVNGNLVFEMEYVEGINLTQLVHKRGALPVPMACDFMRQTALGLQHAHEKGLVHRDIKPSNLVVTRAAVPAAGEPEPSPHGLIKLLDMGLALIQTPEGGQDKTRLTQLGKVVGTTDFLAPEQARNSHGVDIRADLYGLGCTFYYLLTGKVPFPEGAAMEKLLKHQLDEPDAVEKVRPEVAPDLAAVLRKLMAKKPEDRYQTPAEVAAALEPFARPSAKTVPVPATSALATHKVPTLPTAKLASEPAMPIVPPKKPASATIPAATPTAVAVLDPPPAPATRPALADAVQTVPESDPFLNMPTAPRVVPRPAKRSLVLPLLILLLIGSLLGFGGWYLLRHDPGPSAGERSDKDPKRDDNPPPKEAGATGLDRLAADQIPESERIPGQPKELVAVLGEHRQRHWAPITCVGCSPDGGLIATGGTDGFIRLWDAATGKDEGNLFVQPGRVLAVAFLPDDVLLSVNQVGGEVEALSWNLEKMSCTGRTVLNKGGRLVTAVALFTDGDTPIVALAGHKADGTNPVWLAFPRAGEEHPLTPTKDPATQLAWAPDGKHLAAAAGKETKLWSAGKDGKVWGAGAEAGTLPGHDGGTTGLAFTHGGKTLVSTGMAPAKEGPPTAEMKFADVAAKKPGKTVRLLAPAVNLTRDARGSALAWGLVRPRNRVIVWNATDNKERVALGPIDGQTVALSFLAGGKTLVAAGDDQAIHVWDIEKGKERVPPTHFNGRAMSIALSPDDQTLAYAAATADRGVFAWDVIGGKEKVLPRHKGKLGQVVSFVAEGKILGCWGRDGATFWDAAGTELPAFKPPPGATLIGPVAPDGRGLVMVGKDLAVKIWDPTTGKERVAVKDRAKGNNGVAVFSPDSKLVALGGLGHPGVRLYDSETGTEKVPLKGLNGIAVALTFSPDGRRVAAVTPAGAVHVWECATGKDVCQANGRGGAGRLAFSASGTFLAAWGPGSVTIVDVVANKLINDTAAPVSAVAFAPKGETIALLKDVRVVALLDLADTTKDGLREIVLPGPAHALTFSSDGKHVVTANGNGTFYVLRPEGK